MAADKVCCVPRCAKRREDGVILHKFPNPNKDSQRFQAWVQAVGGNLHSLDDMYVFKYRRVCHIHFESKYWTRSKMLSNIAVPTLHITDAITERVPLAELANNSVMSNYMNITAASASSSSLYPNIINSSTSITNYMEESPSPSTSAFLYSGTMKTPTSNLKGTESEKTIMKQKICALKKKVKGLTLKKDNYLKKLKKAMNLTQNKPFLSAVKRFTLMATIFTMLQFRECKKDKKGRRFHKDEKIMALHFYKRGPKVYRMLQKIFVLPSPFTLNKMVSKANIKSGLNENIFHQLKKQASRMKPSHKLCTLVFDEMALTPHLDYSRRNDKITGLVDNGEVVSKELADHVLVFMIRGILKNYKQPLSYSFCAGSTKKAELASMIKKNIRKLNEVGFKVLATVCDQGTSNVSAINYLIKDTKQEYAKAGKEAKDGVFEVDNEEVVPLFDVPHLIKGIRNNLLYKDLSYTIDGIKKTAKWDHIVKLFENNPTYKGVRLIKKLSEKHCDPEKVPKMKVKYASQVFSHTVGINMGFLADQGLLPSECKDTADILLFFDELFDSMNGSCSNSSKRSGKPLLLPVKPRSEHHEIWKKSKVVLKSMKFVSKKGEVTIVPTISNWIRTIENIEKLTKTLFNVYNIKSIWCRHFNQDTLENFFGSIRSHGYRNNSPTCAGFESAFVALMVNNLSSIYSPGSNCENDESYIFKSLKELFFTEYEYKDNSCSEIHYEDICSDNMLVDLTTKKRDPRIIAALEYVTGYLLKQCHTKVFKNCKICVNNLYSPQENNYIKLREYNSKKNYLTYPAIDLVKCFSEIQDIIHFIIKERPDIQNIKSYIKLVLQIRLDFNFLSCENHKSDIVEKLLNTSCIFFLCNWCRDVNKILSGAITNYDQQDLIKCLAFKYKSLRKRK